MSSTKSIEEKIAEVAKATFPNYGYIFADWYDADTEVSRATLPAVISILPVSGSIEFRNGRTYDTENVAIAFVDKVKKDANGSDNAEAYNRMKQAAIRFINALNRSGYFEPVDGSQPYQVIYEQLSDIVTGVMMELQLKEKGRC